MKKLIIGLTGGFGCGKSLVGKFFRAKGALVIDADRIAHEALKKNSPIFKKIADLFPEALSRCGRHFHREKIAGKIFSDPEKRERLEALVHPYVLHEIRKKVRASGKRVVVAEVPLLFEAGFDVVCDRTVVVTCASGVKRKRLLAKGFSLKEVRAREKAQMPEAVKAKKADFIIDNSGPLSAVRKAAEKVWEIFKTNWSNNPPHPAPCLCQGERIKVRGEPKGESKS